jgi:uncharacterized membrane protein
VVISIGTSLRVEPAASLVPDLIWLLILILILILIILFNINLQKTPYDSSAHLRLFANCDQVMQELMQALGTDRPIPIHVRGRVLFTCFSFNAGMEVQAYRSWVAVPCWIQP